MKKLFNKENDRIFEFTKISLLVTLTMISIAIFFVYSTDKFNISYWNDFDTHVEWAKDFNLLKFFSPENILSYPIYHYLTQTLANVFSFSSFTYCFSSAIICTTFILITLYITYYALNWCLKEYQISKKKTFLLAFFLNIFMPIYIPGVNEDVYIGSLASNPWHNPTYIVMKPFAVLCFFYFYYIYTQIEVSIPKMNFHLTLFSISILFSVLAKPSFIFAFLPTLVVFLLIELIATKGKSFWISLKFALTFIPTGLLMLWQMKVTLSNSEAGIIWAPFVVWNEFSELAGTSKLILTVTSLIFPVYVLILYSKKIFKDKLYILTLILAIISISEFIFFAESGERITHGNLTWSMLAGTFILYIVSVIKLLEYQKESKKTKLNKVFVILGFIFLILTFISGVVCILKIFNKIEF